jgi:myo-inositol-1(or 4)-monophosphatase
MAIKQGDLHSMLDTAVTAARLAGRHAMKEINSIKATLKNETELVTAADVHCQKIITDLIKKTYPDHGFIAEEGPAGSLFKQHPRGDEQFWWVIDPIDGTNNFAHGLLCFAVSIAVMHQGRPLVGVIFDPATDSLFTAVEGEEAQLNSRKIQVREEDITPHSSIGLDSHYDDGVPGWTCEIMQKSRFRNLGTTALQLVYVARGSLLATIVNSPKLWDIAAGALIAARAGAVVTDFQGKAVFPLDLANYDGRILPTLAANKTLHSKLVSMIKE